MSIIHDALKKAQQAQSPKADDTPYVYSSPAKPESAADEQPIEHLPPPRQNIAKSMLALLCAIAFFLAALVFSSAQLHKKFPQINKFIKSSYYKLIHKKEEPDTLPKTPAVLVPLAKIIVPPPAAPAQAPIAASTNSPSTNLPNPTNIPAISELPHPVTLNIHGVMSNGKSNVVLIDDQVYQEGDEVDGVKIVKINLDSLSVLINGKEETVRVKD